MLGERAAFGVTHCGSASTPGQRRKVPLPGRFLVSKDIGLIVVGVNLAPALCRSKPAISDGAYNQSPGTEPESDWLLFTAIAGVALDAQNHGVTIQAGPDAGQRRRSSAERSFASNRNWAEAVFRVSRGKRPFAAVR